MNISLFKMASTAAVMSLCCLFPSCVQDDYKDPYPNGKEDAEILFLLDIPVSSAPATRAMSKANEEYVETIDVLVFSKTGDYLYTAYAKTIDQTSRTFTATLTKGDYRIVVLANARGYYDVGDLTAMNLTQAQQHLKIVNNGKWDAGDNFTPIPMWGEQEVKVDYEMKLSVKLVRMLAKLDVYDNTPDNDFALDKVLIYNYNASGLLIPNKSNVRTEKNSEGAVTKVSVTDASLPAGSSVTEGPLEYSGTQVIKDNACTDEIYLFESAKGTKTLSGNTCIVVGGNYNGAYYYYRADFAQTADGVTDFIPILRNHRYILNIREITGPGKSTPEEAFRSAPVNIRAEITAWDEDEMNDITWDGQNQLVVNKCVFDFWADETTAQTLNVYTDVAAGWEVASVEGTWIDVDVRKGSSGSKTPVEIRMTSNASSERTGKITLTAGNLTKIITVRQNGEPQYDYKVKLLSDNNIAASNGYVVWGIVGPRYPTLHMSAVLADGSETLVGGTETVTAGTTTLEKVFFIVDNTSPSIREVKFQYKIEGTDTPETIGSRNQNARSATGGGGGISDGTNYILPNGLVLSKAYAGINGTSGDIAMTWAQANGSSTGCAVYWEGDPEDAVSGMGKWTPPSTVYAGNAMREPLASAWFNLVGGVSWSDKQTNNRGTPLYCYDGHTTNQGYYAQVLTSAVWPGGEPSILPVRCLRMQ